MVTLRVEGLEAGRVYYLAIDPELRSERGEALWVPEGWYTLPALPAAEICRLTGFIHTAYSSK